MDTTQELQSVEITPLAPVDLPVELRGRLSERVKSDWDEIIGAQAELAKGMWVKEYVKNAKTKEQEYDLDGKPIVKVYFRPPDRDAGQFLINQAVGKPKESFEVNKRVNFVMDL